MTDANADAAAAAAKATADAAAAANKPWFDGFDAETKGYVQNRGWDKKTAVEAFAEAAKAHREAEKFVGAPANEMVRLPKDPNSADWKNVYERLGKPTEAKGYDLSSVKRAGDKAIDDALADTIRNAAFAANLPKDAATRVATDLVKYLDAQDTARVALDTDKLNSEKADLKKNWGANEAANMVVARAAANALGVPPEGVAALEKVIGYAKVMEMFRTIGTKIGEDKFIMNQGGQNNGVMTKDQASDELKSLKADAAWVKRYTSGGVDEKRKMDALLRIISGVG